MTLRPSGFVINSPGSITTTTLSANTSIQITPARLNPTTLVSEANQALRAGLSVNVPITSSDTAVGIITVSPVAFGSGSTTGGSAFDPIVQGQSTISIGTPSGFSTPALSQRQIVATVTAPSITVNDASLGKDLQIQGSGSLGAQAPAGGLTITVTSQNPGAVILSTSSTVVGSASVTLQASAGSSAVPNFFIQALAGAGTAQLTVSAPGYATETATVTLFPSGFIINSPGNFSTNSFAANTAVQIASARLTQTLQWSANQALRAGVSVDVDVVSSSTTVGTITASPVHFANSAGTVSTAFDPAQSGTSTISVTAPTGFSTPTTFQQIVATVSAPNLTINTTSILVGRDLQTTQFTLTLENAPPGPVDVTIQASSAGVVGLSKTGTEVGSNSLVFNGVTTTNVGSFVVQGLALGAVTLTAHANGYDDATATATVHPSGFIVNSPGNFSTNTFATNTNIQISSARLTPGTLGWAQNQPLRAGVTASVQVTSSDPTVGIITASPLTIAAGNSLASTTFDPLSSGTTTIAVVTPTGWDTATTFRQITATVSAPGVNIQNVTVGRDLQAQVSVTLDVVPPSPITVTVRSNAPGVVTLSQNAAVAGGDTITFTNVTSVNVGSFFVQGRSLGSTTLTAQAAGYDDGTSNVAVDPSGFIVNSPGNFTTNTFNPNTTIQIASARLSPTTLNWAQNQALRGGLTVEVPVTVSDPGVGVITISPVTVGPGASLASTAFDPQGVGTTTITAGTPAGFSSPSSFRQITATVGTPGININSAIVGRDLQTQVSVTLDAIPPTPVTVTIQTDSPVVATLTQNGTVEGTNTVTFSNVTGITVGSFFVQGRAIGTATLTAQAIGYELSTSNVSVNPSGFIINSPGNFTTTVAAANTNIQITSARLDPVTLNWSANQPVRGGLSVNVPVTSSNTTVGTLIQACSPLGQGWLTYRRRSILSRLAVRRFLSARHQGSVRRVRSL